METLDEVIKAFSEVNKEVGCGDCQFNDTESDDIPCEMTDCIFNDALHYLRKYRATMDDIEAERMLYFKAMERETDNSPLSWNELKQMEGKPVWIELLNHDIWEDPSHRVDSEWWVIGEVRKDDIILATYLDEMELCEEDIGVIWQAYRKEQKNGIHDNKNAELYS